MASIVDYDAKANEAAFKREQIHFDAIAEADSAKALADNARAEARAQRVEEREIRQAEPEKEEHAKAVAELAANRKVIDEKAKLALEAAKEEHATESKMEMEAKKRPLERKDELAQKEHKQRVDKLGAARLLENKAAATKLANNGVAEAVQAMVAADTPGKGAWLDFRAYHGMDEMETHILNCSKRADKRLADVLRSRGVYVKEAKGTLVGHGTESNKDMITTCLRATEAPLMTPAQQAAHENVMIQRPSQGVKLEDLTGGEPGAPSILGKYKLKAAE